MGLGAPPDSDVGFPEPYEAPMDALGLQNGLAQHAEPAAFAGGCCSAQVPVAIPEELREAEASAGTCLQAPPTKHVVVTRAPRCHRGSRVRSRRPPRAHD
jgi:hypothetical protein